RDVGILTTDPTYTATATAYNSMRTYLSGMTPKAWDIESSAATNIAKGTWDSNWNAYYVAFINLQVAVDVKREANMDDIIDDIDTISGNYVLLEERVQSAEQKITDDAIVSTV